MSGLRMNNKTPRSGLWIAKERYLIWLIVLTCFVAGFLVDGWIKAKRENYKGLWEQVGNHEQRIKKLEEK